jgi:hypothetical protein
VGSIVFATGVLAGRSSLPPWTVLASPAPLTIALVVLGAGSVLGRAFLVPMAPNVAHLLFFALAGRGRPWLRDA